MRGTRESRTRCTVTRVLRAPQRNAFSFLPKCLQHDHQIPKETHSNKAFVGRRKHDDACTANLFRSKTSDPTQITGFAGPTLHEAFAWKRQRGCVGVKFESGVTFCLKRIHRQCRMPTSWRCEKKHDCLGLSFWIATHRSPDGPSTRKYHSHRYLKKDFMAMHLCFSSIR